MRRRTSFVIGGTAAVLVVAAGAATAAVRSDTDRPITGPDLEAATAAALAHTGGGRVTETEVGDEEGAYEVEVTLPGGRQVDVHLDRDFTVLGAVADGDGTADEPGDESGDDSEPGS